MAQSRQLEGKLAIVTGASRGIGAGIAANLASKGCNLVMNFTSLSSSRRTSDLAEELAKKHNIKATYVRADMSDPEGPASVITYTKEKFGHQKSGDLTIDIIINNAGVAGNHRLADATPEQYRSEFDRLYRTNVLGPLLLVHSALPYLPTDRSGRIVNVSSISSSMGCPGQSIYGGTKAALDSMTRTWARELNERCTVNSINPGPVATDMYGTAEPWFVEFIRSCNENTPRAQVKEGVDNPEIVKEVKEGLNGKGLGGRAATVEEIAGVVGMLVSPESGWCTGSVICANGGMRFSP